MGSMKTKVERRKKKLITKKADFQNSHKLTTVYMCKQEIENATSTMQFPLLKHSTKSTTSSPLHRKPLNFLHCWLQPKWPQKTFMRKCITQKARSQIIDKSYYGDRYMQKFLYA